MDNSNNSKNVRTISTVSEDGNKLNFIDPNAGEDNVSIENLSISVELYVMKRERSIIQSNTDLKTQLVAQLVDGDAPFNKGEKNEDGSFSLTSKYSDIGNSDYDGAETLGMTSINIEFNSSLMPLITIDLVDIRGRMHELGLDSPYNTFFSLPYPIFKLVIKGYYGEPVEYMLHLTNYNGELDSENANYNISCQFTGYTYAYLSDMLLGYLKAIPYTTEGRQLVESKKQTDPNFVTFDELYEFAKVLNKDILSLKENNESVKGLALGYLRMKEISELEGSFINELKKIDNISYEVASKTGDFIFVKKFTGADDERKTNLITFLAQQTKKIEEISEGENLFNKSLYMIKNNENYFENVKKSDFLNDDGTVKESYSGSIGVIKNNDTIFRGLANAFRAIDVNTTIDIIYFKNIFDDISKVKKSFKLLMKKRQNEISDLFFEEIEELTITDSSGKIRSFEFNLKNYIKVLCDHVDILMDSIRMVSDKAESDNLRNSELISGNGVLDVNNPQSLTKIYGFPDYKKKGSESIVGSSSEVLKDVWIGIDHPFIDEVRFIEELYAGLIASKKSENNFLAYLENAQTQWYSINPFDSIHYTGSESPWASVGNTFGHDGEIIRLMTLRAITFLAVSTRNPSNAEITCMAKLEANNAFIHMKNQQAKDYLDSLVGNDDKLTAQYVRKFISNPCLVNKNTSYPVNFGRILKSEGLVDEYIYVTDTNNPLKPPFTHEGYTDDARFFLPLHFKDKSTKYTGDSLVGPNRVKNTDDYFFSDYAGDSTNKIIDGAKFVDILTTDQYSITQNSPTYGPKIIDGQIKNGVTLDVEDLTGDFRGILFNGGWNHNEIMSYTNSGETYEFYTYFYDSEDTSQDLRPFFSSKKIKAHGGEFMEDGEFKKGRIVGGTPELTKPTREEYGNTIKGLYSEDKALPFITFYSNPHSKLEYLADEDKPYSLFGSEYYYGQTSNLGKAFLFLHTIPFKGLEGGGSVHLTEDSLKDGRLFNGTNILNLFDQKSGFIQMPYSWILFIGGLLYRMEEEEILVFDDGEYNLLPKTYNEYDLPQRDEYLKGNMGKHSYIDATLTTGYYKIDKVLKNLPNSVKKKFKDEFVGWTNTGFKEIQAQCEIFKTGTTKSNRIGYWKTMEKRLKVNPKEVYADEIINPNVIKNYDTFQVDLTLFSKLEVDKLLGEGTNVDDFLVDIIEPGKGNPYMFYLELKDNSVAVNNVIDFLNEKRIFVNGTYRIWANLKNHTIRASTREVDKYITEFIKEIRVLRSDNLDAEKREMFKMTDNDDIYLTMYKNIKSIKDKWISSDNLGFFNNLINSFNFIDRGYNDIGTAFKLNPLQVTSLLRSNMNVSMYAHVSRVLSDNNFDFVAMPNFIDFGDRKTMESVFKTFSFSSALNTHGPGFVCMYIGERSNRLDITSDTPQDGFNISEDEADVPEDYNNVPAFLVNYGDGNQSIFKSIGLNQAEFSETNESLMVTDQIASSYNNINSIGQNIYQMYMTRAYNATIEMLGNAMIQPFMYFQLNNVPMFNGAFVITKVSHSIIPNHMTTKFIGNRVKRSKTQLLEKSTIFNNLIGDFGEIDYSDATMKDLIDGNGFPTPSSKSQNKVKTNNNDTMKPTPVLTSDNNPDVYVKAFKPKNYGESYFNANSNTKRNGVFMTYNEIYEEVYKITGIPVLSLKTMSIMESGVGTAKTVANGLPNHAGYVGHMQFGWQAAKTVLKSINDVIFGGDYDDVEFGAIVDLAGKTIILAPLRSEGAIHWVKEPELSNKDTNSFFDDFINILGAGFLAKGNLNSLGTSYDNVTDIYLSHQQGYSKVEFIKNNSTKKISHPLTVNMPTFRKNVNTNQDWYLSWAGQIEATAKNIDSSYELIVGNEDDVA